MKITAKKSSSKAAKSPGKAAGKSSAKPSTESRRLWLSYPPKLITRPMIWEMSQKYPIIFNVRQASVSDAIGILCLELQGERAVIKAAIAWLEKIGVQVEPVEIGVIES